MKILMLTPYLPYPPSSGGQIRTYNLLKYLSKNNDITLISLYKYSYERDYLKHLQQFCRQIYLCQRPEKPWQFKLVVKAVLSNKPFLVVRNYSKEAAQVVKRLLNKEHFDVIHAETFYIMPHLPETKIPVVLVEQTIEYKVYQHFVNSLPIFVRPAFYLDIVKLIYWERYYWRKANLVATVSNSDRKKILELEAKLKPVVIPNGAGDEMLKIKLVNKNLNRPKLLFIGNFFWLQNVEAAIYLVRQVYPQLVKALLKVRLIIAGQNARNKLREINDDRIEVVDIKTDDIKKVKELYQKATLFIAPIFGPGGTRLKILAAMAAGLPIISTKTGIQGLDLKAEKDVLIANDAQEFKTKIKRILKNPKLFANIQTNAYKIVREKYSWEKIAQELEGVYRKLK